MNLNRKHFAELFRVDYKTVSVTFEESDIKEFTGAPSKAAVRYAQSFTDPVGDPTRSKRYTYKMPKTMDVRIGEQLLVAVSQSSIIEYKVVTVREVHEHPEVNSSTSFNYKWVVGKLSDITADYQANVARDNQLKIAVERLETALSKVELRKSLKLALDELPLEEADELRSLFNDTALGQPTAAPALADEKLVQN